MAAQLGAISLKFIADTGSAIANVGKMGTAVAGFSVTALAAHAAMKAVGSAAQYEKAFVAFEVMTGSAKKAGETLGTLQKLAIETPFTSRELIDQAKLFAGYGVATDDLVPTLTRLGDAASGTGADIGRLGLAYGQVIAKGKFQGTELRQFTEAGGGVRDFAKAAGVSTTRLYSMMEAGQGSSKVVRAFEQMTGSGGRFFNMMEKQSQTVAGRWSAVTESLDLLGQKIGLAAFKSLDVAGTLDRIAKTIQSMKGPELDRWLARAGTAGQRLADLGEALLRAGTRLAGDGAGFLPSLEGITLWIDRNGDDLVKTFARIAVEIEIAAIRMGDLVGAANDFKNMAALFGGFAGVNAVVDRVNPLNFALKDRADEFAQLRANADNAGGLFAQVKEERRLRSHWKRVGEQMKFVREGGEQGKINRFLLPKVEEAQKGVQDAMGWIADRVAPGWLDAAQKAAGAGQKAAAEFERFGEFKRRLDFGVAAGQLDRKARDAALVGRFRAWKEMDAASAQQSAVPGFFARSGSVESQAAINAAIAATSGSKGGESQTEQFKRFMAQEEEHFREQIKVERDMLRAIEGWNMNAGGFHGVRL